MQLVSLADQNRNLSGAKKTKPYSIKGLSLELLTAGSSACDYYKLNPSDEQKYGVVEFTLQLSV